MTNEKKELWEIFNEISNAGMWCEEHPRFDPEDVKQYFKEKRRSYID